MHTVGLVIVVGWLAFWAFWLLEARGVKAGQDGWGRYLGGRVVIVVLIIVFLRYTGIGLHKLTTDAWLAGAGLAVWAIGLALAIWARLYIGRNWGMPMTRKQEPDLVTTGPYRSIRHPIYTGLILGMVGTVLATIIVGLIPVALVTAYFIYSAVNEERYLTERFPDAYPEYQRHSKMLIPYILLFNEGGGAGLPREHGYFLSRMHHDIRLARPEPCSQNPTLICAEQDRRPGTRAGGRA